MLTLAYTVDHSIRDWFLFLLAKESYKGLFYLLPVTSQNIVD